MNIFKALSQGNGSITETNITSFLSFLLNKTHDIDNLFCILFFEYVGNVSGRNLYTEILNIQTKNIREKLNKFNENYTVLAEPEFPIKGNDKTRIVDILLTVYDKEKEKNILYCLIENKIRKSSKKDGQPSEQYSCFIESDNFETDVKVFSIMLTNDDDNFTSVFDDLKNTNSNCVWLKWTNKIRPEESIEHYLKAILEYERRADIQPLDFTTQFILKSFIDYISSEYSKKEINEDNFSVGGSDVMDSLLINIDGYEYKLKRYDNNMIRFYDENGDLFQGETKPKLRRINLQYDLNVDYKNTSGNDKNTQQLGKDIIQAYKIKYLQK